MKRSMATHRTLRCRAAVLTTAVAVSPFDRILGADVLAAYGAVVDFGHNTRYLHPAELP